MKESQAAGRPHTLVKYRSLDSLSDGRKLFLMCWIIYCITYLGRLNFSAALADIVTNNVMPRDKAGLISTAFFFMYGLGQLVNGYLGDRTSPFRMIGRGVLLAGVSNCLMFAVTRITAIPELCILIWGLNGFSQSSIWSPAIRIVSSMLPEKQRVQACIRMMITTAAGTLLSYLLSTLLLSIADWQTVFIVPGILLILAGTMWFILTTPFIRRLEYRVEAVPKDEKAKTDETTGKGLLLPLLVTSGVVFMFVLVALMAMVRDGVSTWTPTFIADIFGTSAALSVLLTTLLPLVNLLASPFTRLVNEKWLHNELKSTAFFFLVVTSAVILLYLFGTMHIALMITLMAVISCSTLCINTLLLSLVPMHFSFYGRVATITGILNCVAALSNSMSSMIVGFVTAHWSVFVMIGIWCVMGTIGMIVALLSSGRWKRFTADTDSRRAAETPAQN